MNRARTGARSTAIELRLAVWQFVRVMVQLETVAHARGRREAPSVYGDWKAAWTEIDRTLTHLGETDAGAFSDLMMNQEVVLGCRDRSQLNQVTRAIGNVVNQLDRQIRAVRDDPRAEEELRFERRELNALSRRLHKLGRAPGKPSGAVSAPRRARTRKG